MLAPFIFTTASSRSYECFQKETTYSVKVPCSIKNVHLASKKAKHYSLSCHFKSYSWAKVDAEIPVIVFLWLPSTPNQMGGCWEARAFATTTLAWHSCSQTSSQQGANLPSSRTRASESELSSLAMFPSAKAKSRSVSSTCSFNNAWSATTLNSPSPGLPLSLRKSFLHTVMLLGISFTILVQAH